MWHGQLLHIHTTATARAPMVEQTAATLIAGVGIEGDRYAQGIDTGTYSALPDVCEVTEICAEVGDA